MSANNIDLSVNGNALKTEPQQTKRPMMIMTGPSLEDYYEDDEVTLRSDRPTEFEPRIRRVSDVIDSMGEASSLPSSPRFSTFIEQQRHSAPITPRETVMTFLPDWLKKASNDVTDSPATKRNTDKTDAAPMSSSLLPGEEEYDDNGLPKTVLANMPVEKDSYEYNMNHPRRGKAIIFNHDTFDMPTYSSRPGSEVDAKNLEASFRALHFQVTIYHNMEYAEIKKVIEELKAEDHSDADCLMITVLSHGIQGGYVLSKDVPYSVDYLWHSFKANVCPTLAGKPKLFFIQACRGESLDSGVTMMRAKNVASRTQVDSASSDYKIPSFADFLIAFSTVDGHYAWRNPDSGTWFIQCLCKELRLSGTTTDLLKLLTRAARRVALDFQSFNDLNPFVHEMKQVPSITTMLIRDLTFTPKVGNYGDVTVAPMEVDQKHLAFG